MLMTEPEQGHWSCGLRRASPKSVAIVDPGQMARYTSSATTTVSNAIRIAEAYVRGRPL
jgi:hypothetical protein